MIMKMHRLRRAIRDFIPPLRTDLVRATRLGPLCLLIVVAITGCQSTDRAHPTAEYVLAYLKTGPRSGELTPAQSKEVFAGHMANIRRLGEARQLVIAGPFDHPHDASWRGIFVLDVPTTQQAAGLVQSDPAVQAQIFVVELCPMKASPALRQTHDLEQQLRASQSQPAEQAPGQPPPNIRAYVMITSSDAAKTERTLKATVLGSKVVWWGRLDGERAGQGVFVLDEESIDRVKTALSESKADFAECTIDGWWSSKSISKLPAEAGWGLGLGGRH